MPMEPHKVALMKWWLTWLVLTGADQLLLMPPLSPSFHLFLSFFLLFLLCVFSSTLLLSPFLLCSFFSHPFSSSFSCHFPTLLLSSCSSAVCFDVVGASAMDCTERYLPPLAVAPIFLYSAIHSSASSARTTPRFLVYW